MREKASKSCKLELELLGPSLVLATPPSPVNDGDNVLNILNTDSFMQRISKHLSAHSALIFTAASALP
jgi:hypothetical protein